MSGEEISSESSSVEFEGPGIHVVVAHVRTVLEDLLCTMGWTLKPEHDDDQTEYGDTLRGVVEEFFENTFDAYEPESSSEEDDYDEEESEEDEDEAPEPDMMLVDDDEE